MLEKELSFADLSISLSELYEAMGYADAVPDEAVEKKSVGYWNGWRQLLLPVFVFSYPVESWMNRKTRFLSAIRVSV